MLLIKMKVVLHESLKKSLYFPVLHDLHKLPPGNFYGIVYESTKANLMAVTGFRNKMIAI